VALEMAADRNGDTTVHLVGSVPLPDTETVLTTVTKALGPHLERLPDGETGVRKNWIGFLIGAMRANPAVEPALDHPPHRLTQWDGKILNETTFLRLKPGARLAPESFNTGYAKMAIDSWAIFDRLQKAGVIPGHIKFQVSLPTPMAPIYGNVLPSHRAGFLAPLAEHFVGEVKAIAAAVPHDRLAIQWDVCQEVLAWEGYYEAGPTDFPTEIVEMLAMLGEAVPSDIDLGYHLCYGSPADEHIILPKDSGVMVEMINALVVRIERPIAFLHLPVPKDRTDDAYFAPLERLRMKPGRKLYLGLIHSGDEAGNQTRLAAARRHVRVDGIGTECGMGRKDIAGLASLLVDHARAARF
jgi:hypothetical protein